MLATRCTTWRDGDHLNDLPAEARCQRRGRFAEQSELLSKHTNTADRTEIARWLLEDVQERLPEGWSCTWQSSRKLSNQSRDQHANLGTPCSRPLGALLQHRGGNITSATKPNSPVLKLYLRQRCTSQNIRTAEATNSFHTLLRSDGRIIDGRGHSIFVDGHNQISCSL